MKLRAVILPFIFLLLFIAATPLQSQGFILKKDIHVAEGDVQNNVVTFDGTITVLGKVQENVIAFGGKVIIEGEVGKLVMGFGSEIILKENAKIHGDVVSIAGNLKKELGVEIDGDTIDFEMENAGDFKTLVRKVIFGASGFSLIPLFLIIKAITLFLWLVGAIALISIFPRQIAYASSQIRQAFWPIFGTGLLSIIIYGFLIIFSVFLSLILIGIPIMIVLVLLGFVIKIFGRVVLFFFFGEALAKAIGNKNPSAVLVVIFGLIFIGFVGFIPILGSLFSFVLSIIGWGVIIRTKFGMTENWFRR
jgi:hypothetical protein